MTHLDLQDPDLQAHTQLDAGAWLLLWKLLQLYFLEVCVLLPHYITRYY